MTAEQKLADLEAALEIADRRMLKAEAKEAELEAALSTARADALEEAAKVCEEVRGPLHYTYTQAEYACDQCADEIRSLKEKK
jgi:hypothetical protein